jgi:hypothetical protein
LFYHLTRRHFQDWICTSLFASQKTQHLCRRKQEQDGEHDEGDYLDCQFTSCHPDLFTEVYLMTGIEGKSSEHFQP